LDELAGQLQVGTYIQHPYREVLIPKNQNEKRRLGLLTVNDKIVQTAVTMVVTPLIEKNFLNVSYAYRTNKGAVKAINRVRHLINNEKYVWLAACDIDNFFDTIPHDALFGKLASFLKSPGTIELIKMFVAMGRVDKHYHWKGSHKGIPQGGVISPLLANFYLTPLDRAMVEKGFGFVRYSDDFVLLGHTENEAIQALNEATQIITKQLQLALNEEGKIVPVSEGFEFLGIFFKDGKLDLSERKYKRLVTKMIEAAGQGPDINVEKLKETVSGIANFYGKLIPQEALEKLDDELMGIILLRLNSDKKDQKQYESRLKAINAIPFLADSHNLNRVGYIKDKLSYTEKKALRRKNKQKVINSRKAVLTRKHEYQKLESSGFDLVLTQPGFVLGKKEKKVTVKYHGEVIKEVPLINLKNITILSEGISISSNLIKTCSEYEVSVDFIDKNGLPYAMVMTPTFFSAEIGRAQLEAYTNGKAVLLIRKFVVGKISNQINLMKYYGKYYLSRNPVFESKFSLSIETMENYKEKVMTLKEDNLDDFRQKMFAVEGQASANYWEMVAILLAPKVNFPGRVNQGATDLVNSMLNYGYGILYAGVTEAIIRAHLNPCLSYLHKPEGKKLSLVYDLIEEFRQQAVDRVVIALIMKNKHLDMENDLLNDSTRKLVAQKVIDRQNNVEVFQNREMRFSEIIQRQAVMLSKYLDGTNQKYKPYVSKW
ncbi:MAG TPA: CRISPR-associated endonuclease Cas1, partial [Bacteroidales bacterium]|nr:CRISPR-associated endonuclease Cas1 [Bacteroidales bacterium]